MSTASPSSSSSERTGRKPSCSGSVWTPMNIAIMALAFFLFMPLGILVLIGLIAGVSPLQLPAKIASWASQASEGFEGMRAATGTRRAASGNAVFDEYQQTQIDRIEEIRTEVKERDTQFANFKIDEQRAKDRKQFDRFMGRDGDDL